MPGFAWSTFAASDATWAHVGLAGMVRFLLAKTSLRYMRNEDSP